MKRSKLDKMGEWQRNRQRNKAKKPKPLAICSCPSTGYSTLCSVKEHKERAKLLQSTGWNPIFAGKVPPNIEKEL